MNSGKRYPLSRHHIFISSRSLFRHWTMHVNLLVWLHKRGKLTVSWKLLYRLETMSTHDRLPAQLLLGRERKSHPPVYLLQHIRLRSSILSISVQLGRSQLAVSGCSTGGNLIMDDRDRSWMIERQEPLRAFVPVRCQHQVSLWRCKSPSDLFPHKPEWSCRQLRSHSSEDQSVAWFESIAWGCQRAGRWTLVRSQPRIIDWQSEEGGGIRDRQRCEEWSLQLQVHERDHEWWHGRGPHAAPHESLERFHIFDWFERLDRHTQRMWSHWSP